MLISFDYFGLFVGMTTMFARLLSADERGDLVIRANRAGT